MKIKQILLFVFALCISATQAQTADEIIAKFIENTGGYDKWSKVEGLKMSAKVNQGGIEFPLVILQMKDGRQGQLITFQGKEIKQGMFDGKDLWSSNPMADKTERSDAESTENVKANLGADFPLPLFDYKKFGYKVEFLGKETIDGTETFKIKYTKNPVKVDGKPKESVEYYFFDTENFIPLMVESELTQGPGKGMITQLKLSDYQEIPNSGGLIMPFSWTQGAKGQAGGQPINFTSIELNPKVDASVFTYPGQK
jgi:outer membrane lipoprotein-sorting protein